MANEQKLPQAPAISHQPSSGRIGVFGGTFDPIHLGHLMLAEEAFKKLQLDQLILIPAKISPYKINLPPAASEADRLAMMELAIGGKNEWRVDTRELFRPGPSFTIDTIKELKQENQGASFFLFIGEDQLPGLAGWKEIEALPKLVSFVIFSRMGSVEKSMTDPVFRNSMADPISIGNRCIDISSTNIRERLAKNENVDYLLSSSIHDYIQNNSLYQKTNC